MNRNSNQKYRINFPWAVVLCALIGFSFVSFSQEKTIEEPPYKLKAEKPFYPRFFINYSYINPIGKFRRGQEFSTPYPPEEVEYMGDTYESSMPAMGLGFSFEVGNLFWIRKLDFHPKLKFGIMAVYADIQFLFEKNNTHNDEILNFVAAKVGPYVSYNPIGALLINFRPTLEFTVGANNSEQMYLRGGAGIDIRYKRLSLGLDFSFGKEGFNLESSYGSHHFSTSIMRVTFGLNFLQVKMD